jgi:hypothetical protein
VTVTIKVAERTAANVGAHPVVLSSGRAAPYDEDDPMLSQQEPRTAVGWDDSGQVWLVAVDGRQARDAGLTAAQTVHFLRQLGVQHAVFEDGGGSTTFSLRGRLTNQPSDGEERLVANAILLVQSKRVALRRAVLPPTSAGPARQRGFTVVMAPRPAPAVTARPVRWTRPPVRRMAVRSASPSPSTLMAVTPATTLDPTTPDPPKQQLPTAARQAGPPPPLPVGIALAAVSVASGTLLHSVVRRRREL